MKIEIKHRFTGKILFSVETDSWRLAVEAAVRSRANLSGANLSGADLSGANLYGANLTGANLTGAYLYGATYSQLTLWPEGFDLTGKGLVKLNSREGRTK